MPVATTHLSLPLPLQPTPPPPWPPTPTPPAHKHSLQLLLLAATEHSCHQLAQPGRAQQGTARPVERGQQGGGRTGRWRRHSTSLPMATSAYTEATPPNVMSLAYASSCASPAPPPDLTEPSTSPARASAQAQTQHARTYAQRRLAAASGHMIRYGASAAGAGISVRVWCCAELSLTLENAALSGSKTHLSPCQMGRRGKSAI